ncbi:MAG: sulfatase-like hydrolase/transferase [Anaerolineae bacterium]|nr:sulfatase-like hydrolase/transferase [Anaerolineae bacterium]
MPRPNILLFFTDQQRADTIHAGGNPVIRTPNLDRLAQEGVRFSSAFTPSPVCVSARCSMIHGQYPHNTGCAYNGDPMPTDRPSFMQVLTEAGYRTHGIGKMHFRPDPQAMRGWQTREHQEEIRHSIDDDDYLQFLRSKGYTHIYDPMGQRGEMYYIPQLAQMPAEYHATHWVGDRSIAFIREQATSDQPWLLMSSYIHPHPPFSPPTPWNKLYRAPLMPLPKMPHQSEAYWTYINRVQNRYKYRDNGIDYNLLRCLKAFYYACISFIDYQVGRILAALEETGQLDNTLILYASDHGEFLGDYFCFGKRSMLNPACNIPLMARFPQRFAQGTVNDAPVSLVDIMPTMLAAAGVERDDLSLDGVDLAEVAEASETSPLSQRTVYSQYQHRELGVYMALNRDYKYFYSAPDRREWLFDRQEDPEEMRSQAGLVFRRSALEAMRDNLWSFYRSQGYDEPLTPEGWREFPQPSLPDDPDEGLLIQDAPWADPYQRIPGYTQD